MREWFRWQSGDEAKVVRRQRRGVHESAASTPLLFVLVVAPVQAGLALLLALLINQRLRGINIYPNDLFHACGDLDRRRLAAVAIHL